MKMKLIRVQNNVQLERNIINKDFKLKVQNTLMHIYV